MRVQIDFYLIIYGVFPFPRTYELVLTLTSVSVDNIRVGGRLSEPGSIGEYSVLY